MTETTAAARPASTDPKRAEFTAGLRALADFIDTHPEMPLPRGADARVFLNGTDDEDRAEVDRVAGILGVQPERTLHGHYRAERDFGGRVTCAAIAVPAQRMAQHIALMSYDSAVTP